MSQNLTGIVARLLPDAGGETPMRHRSAVVTAVNADGTLDVDLSGVTVTVNALAGSAADVGDTVHLAAWAGDLLSLGKVRPAGVGGMAQHVMIPSGATVGGGGATVSVDGGEVSFADATSVNVDDCFIPGFRNYDIDLSLSAASGASNILMRVRVGGADLSTGTYLSAVISMASTTPAYIFDGAATSIIVARVDATGGTGSPIKVMSPAHAEYTRVVSDSMDAAFVRHLWGTVKNSTVYDGLTILTGSALTMTGRLCVYGRGTS